MRDEMRVLLLTLLLAMLTQIQAFSQAEKKIIFYGYNLTQYKQPILRYGDTYEAYFENLGDKREQGKIIISEETKTFTIKWLNGDDWTCKYTNVESKNENDDWFGEVTRKKYIGKWTDTGKDAMLVITYTSSSGCITTIKSQKVIDMEYGIDTWKKTFTFSTGGECVY